MDRKTEQDEGVRRGSAAETRHCGKVCAAHVRSNVHKRRMTTLSRSWLRRDAVGVWLAALALACGSGDAPRLDPVQDVPPLLTDDWSPPPGPPAGSPVATHGQLRVEGTQLLDESGAPVQLRGVSSMWLNYDIGGFGVNKEGLRFMRDHWGITVYRAAMGVEPMGAYLDDETTAKNQLTRIIRNALDLGVYVIIDWHDHEAEAHVEEAAAFFSEMAREWGQYPNVLYETYNEPLVVPWDDVVRPYHERAVRAIREHDPDNVVILGTPFWSQAVDDAALNPLEGDNLMYTLHFYSCTHRADLRARADTALEAGLALFVTEWGASHADGGLDGIVCEDEAEQWLQWLEQHRISWVAWKLDGCSDSTCFFADKGVPRSGPWPDEVLHGHAPLVVRHLRAAAEVD